VPAGVVKVYDQDSEGSEKLIFTAHSDAKTMAGWTDLPSDHLHHEVFLGFHDIETGRKLTAEGIILDIETVWRDGIPTVSVYASMEKVRYY
jgi:hypothetical protein